MKNKKVKTVLIVIAVIAILFFMPFVTVMVKDGTGRSFRAPFGSWFSGDSDVISFSSLRSSYAIGKDAANALHSYEEEKCYGTTYFYDESNDLSYTGVEKDSGYPSKVTYTHENGNACAGWTTNDEIAWPFGSIKEADLNISEADAKDKDWLVVKDGEAENIGVYNDFANMVKQGVYCYMRTLVIDGDERKFVDIQLLETAENEQQAQNASDVKKEEEKEEASSSEEDEGLFRVQIRTEDSVTDERYARYSEVTEDGHKYVAVYKENYSSAEPVILFQLS